MCIYKITSDFWIIERKNNARSALYHMQTHTHTHKHSMECALASARERGSGRDEAKIICTLVDIILILLSPLIQISFYSWRLMETQTETNRFVFAKVWRKKIYKERDRAKEINAKERVQKTIQIEWSERSKHKKNAEDKFTFSDFRRFITLRIAEIMTMCFSLALVFVVWHAIFFQLFVLCCCCCCLVVAASNMHTEYHYHFRYSSNTRAAFNSFIFFFLPARK